MLTTRAHAFPRLAATLVVMLTLAACGNAAAPSPSPAQVTPRPTPTPVPGEGGNVGGGTDPGSGGGSGSGGNSGGGNTGGGIIIPVPGDPNQNPLLGGATYLFPTQDLVNQRTVNVQLVRAVRADDGTVTADLRWWSGVAPCSQLDHVEILEDDAAHTIRLKVIEGSGQGDVACIDIAQLSATAVDLGKLASATWSISAEGDAPAITLDVP